MLQCVPCRLAPYLPLSAHKKRLLESFARQNTLSVCTLLAHLSKSYSCLLHSKYATGVVHAYVLHNCWFLTMPWLMSFSGIPHFCDGIWADDPYKTHCQKEMIFLTTTVMATTTGGSVTKGNNSNDCSGVDGGGRGSSS